MGVGDAIAGLRVLVVEDQFLIADTLAAMLDGFGCVVVGPVASVEAALAEIKASAPDMALLDIQLNRATAQPLAEALRALGVPFILVTGYAEPSAEPAFKDAPRLGKPISGAELRQALSDAAARRRG